jgi:hypothetical protein
MASRDESWAQAAAAAAAAAARPTTALVAPANKRAAVPAGAVGADAVTDSLTGMLLTSPTKRLRSGGAADTTTAGSAAAAATSSSATGYSPELSLALKSVVKIFTTVAKCVWFV